MQFIWKKCVYGIEAITVVNNAVMMMEGITVLNSVDFVLSD